MSRYTKRVLAADLSTPAAVDNTDRWHLALFALAAGVALLLLVWPSIDLAQSNVQFGYRYALDFLPFLLLLAALGFPEPISTRARVLVILSVVINVWGAIILSHWLWPRSVSAARSNFRHWYICPRELV